MGGRGSKGRSNGRDPRTAATTEEAVRRAFWNVVGRSRYPRGAGAVLLSELRPLLAHIPRAEQDRALDKLIESPDVRIEAELAQRLLTDRDHDAAVTIGGELRHVIRIVRPGSHDG